MGWLSSTWDFYKGAYTATTLGTLGALGSLLPGGAKPSEIPQIYRNAWSLGSDGGFTRNDGTTSTWSDLGPHMVDGYSSILPKAGEILGDQINRTFDATWDGLDLPDIDFGKLVLPAALVAGALLLSRS